MHDPGAQQPGAQPDDDDRAQGGPAGSESDDEPVIERVCELCGGRAIERHCKIQCLNCGYQRDCSDP